MKSAEPTEASPYSSALTRVRNLRADPHSVPVQPSNFVPRLKLRIQQVRARLHFPARSAEVLALHKTTPYKSDRLEWVIFICLPMLLLAVFVCLITNPATSQNAAVPVQPNFGVQFFAYPVPQKQTTLSEGTALAITAQILSRAGYDLREWEGAEFDSIKQVNTIAKNRFTRVDARSGYYIFEQWLETEPPKYNQPAKETFRRLTVTLKQDDETLKVILSDSVRTRLRSH